MEASAPGVWYVGLRCVACSTPILYAATPRGPNRVKIETEPGAEAWIVVQCQQSGCGTRADYRPEDLRNFRVEQEQ